MKTHNIPEFADLWKELEQRSQTFAMPIVQEYNELEHVYNLVRECESYLEVGCAEGNSLYVLSRAIKPWARIKFIDLGEPHTKKARDAVLDKLGSIAIGRPVGIFGDSTKPETLAQLNGERFDAVFIDADHTYESVKSDAAFYGPLADKYIIFHDVCLPEVERAFDEYAAGKKHYKIKNSKYYGYGIVEVQA